MIHAETATTPALVAGYGRRSGGNRRFLRHDGFQEVGMDNRGIVDTFVRILKLETMPVAVSLVTDREKLQRKPLPFPVNICQLISLSRHQGRQAAGVPERMVCAIGAACTGLIETPQAFRDGTAAVGRYVATPEAGAEFFRNTFKLGDSGAKYQAIHTVPLSDYPADAAPPDAVVFYCNPAQVMRLVHAVLYRTGEKVAADTVAEAAVCSSIGFVAATGRPVIGFPCAGDRRFGGTQNHELVFVAPYGILEGMATALVELSKSGGALYPVPPNVMWTPQMPPAYTIPASPDREA